MVIAINFPPPPKFLETDSQEKVFVGKNRVYFLKVNLRDVHGVDAHLATCLPGNDHYRMSHAIGSGTQHHHTLQGLRFLRQWN